MKEEGVGHFKWRSVRNLKIVGAEGESSNY